MKYNVVSFSGGRTSAYMIHRIQAMVSQGLIDNVKYVFMDTGAEHPKTYEFIRQVVKHFDIDLVCIRAVMTTEVGIGPRYKKVSIDDICDDYGPWKEMLKCYSTPFIHGAMCTDRMKTAPYKKYCDEAFGRNNYTSWLGIRIDEPRRLNPKKGYRFLAEISPMDKQDILGWWKDQPFDLGIDEWLGNCVFCIKKGVNKIALAAIDEPELAADFWDMLNTQPLRIIETRVDDPLVMYRGNHTFQSAQDSFADVGRDDIISRMRGNNGGCNESCEVFGCQGDLFKEVTNKLNYGPLEEHNILIRLDGIYNSIIGMPSHTANMSITIWDAFEGLIDDKLVDKIMAALDPYKDLICGIIKERYSTNHLYQQSTVLFVYWMLIAGKARLISDWPLESSILTPLANDLGVSIHS